MTREELLTNREWLNDIPWTNAFWNIQDNTDGDNKQGLETTLKGIIVNTQNDKPVIKGFGLWDGDNFTYIETNNISELEAIAKAVLMELYIPRPPSIIVLDYTDKQPIRFIEYSYRSVDRTNSTQAGENIEYFNILNEGEVIVNKYLITNTQNLNELQNHYCVLTGTELILPTYSP